MQGIIGVVQHYDWGDKEVIPELVGEPADGRPWAELWLGTHPNGPARFVDGRELSEVTGPLPYLLKVLAAAEPLSLQTHPSLEQARAGHERGVFGDPFAKPELLCALTPVEALCGVRPVDQTLSLLDSIGVDELRDALKNRGVAETIAAVLRGQVDVAAVVDACAGAAGRHREAAWVKKLADRYPADPSVAVTLLLNRVDLEPGQAVRLGPGNLHAYLHGAGVELMSPSDNVVRAGLTRKAVETELLLEILDPTPLADPIVEVSDRYDLTGTSIALDRKLGPVSHTAQTHELFVTSAGQTGYLAPGETWSVPDGATAYIATA